MKKYSKMLMGETGYVQIFGTMLGFCKVSVGFSKSHLEEQPPGPDPQWFQSQQRCGAGICIHTALYWLASREHLRKVLCELGVGDRKRQKTAPPVSHWILVWMSLRSPLYSDHRAGEFGWPQSVLVPLPFAIRYHIFGAAIDDYISSPIWSDLHFHSWSWAT